MVLPMTRGALKNDDATNCPAMYGAIIWPPCLPNVVKPAAAVRSLGGTTAIV